MSDENINEVPHRYVVYEPNNWIVFDGVLRMGLYNAALRLDQYEHELATLRAELEEANEAREGEKLLANKYFDAMKSAQRETQAEKDITRELRKFLRSEARRAEAAEARCAELEKDRERLEAHRRLLSRTASKVQDATIQNKDADLVLSEIAYIIEWLTEEERKLHAAGKPSDAVKEQGDG